VQPEQRAASLSSNFDEDDAPILHYRMKLNSDDDNVHDAISDVIDAAGSAIPPEPVEDTDMGEDSLSPPCLSLSHRRLS
jgi:hypothetical protein